MDGSQTIPLTTPIEVDGQTISSITIRPPTEEDVAAVRLLNVGRAVRGRRFISRLIGLPPQAFGDIQDQNPDAALAIGRFIDEHMGW